MDNKINQDKDDKDNKDKNKNYEGNKLDYVMFCCKKEYLLYSLCFIFFLFFGRGDLVFCK